MTDEEMGQWGREENERRMAEMTNVDSPEALDAVKVACAKRRNAIGLSAGKAAFWVLVGQRLERGESLSFAIHTRR